MKPGQKIANVSAVAAQTVSINIPDGLPERRIYEGYQGSTVYVMDTEQAVKLYNDLVEALFK
jgi:hypothetical protein